VLKKDARAVLQFYPETPEQAVIIAQAASKVGFAGGVVVDYPNSSKAKKYYLCLSFERTFKLPGAMGTGSADTAGVQVVGRERQGERRSGSASGKPQRPAIKSVDWIKNKKEQRRKHGKEVKADSKFSGRRRPAPF
jgi:18S rRNA (guanine1575-N7)-methyltransferase